MKSFSSSKPNPFSHVQKSFTVGNQTLNYFSLPDLQDSRIEKLPYSIRVLLESAVRNCDEFKISSQDVEKILNWKTTSQLDVEIPFKPARVVLQDFTGVPAVVDLAAMRDAMARLGKDPSQINPQIPVDLVIDHSVQADVSRVKNAFLKNEEIEFARNYERFEFLKWGQNAFKNFSITPPGSGIVHQVNLEHLARVVMQNENNMLYPDSLVGTDSHTTMINGLGVTGWGVGGIEAEAVMLGEAIAMVLPKVVGFKLTGQLKQHVTATDLVLTIVQMLRKRGVVGQFVEFFGEGVQHLSLADRATIANMAPEYGATMGFFPVDEQSIDYLKLTGRSSEKVQIVKEYLTRQSLFRKYDGSQVDPDFSGAIMELDISQVEPCLSGPKRPHDRVPMSQMKSDWKQCLSNKPGFKGFGVKEEAMNQEAPFHFNGKDYNLKHGSVIIAAITSCTNTSNPDVMMQAGLLARNAVAKGLEVAPYIKTTLSPGSQVVSSYLEKSGLDKDLEKLGFYNAGYGCMTCIGNSGELDQPVSQAIQDKDIVACAVLSGNRNFEARVHPLSRGNYLASPPLVVAYALAGTVNIDFETEPIGKDKSGNDIFLKDIWPSRQQTSDACAEYLKADQFTEVYKRISKGTDRWNAMQVPLDKQFQWKDTSTYIHNPPFFQDLQAEPSEVQDIKGAYCLLSFGDSITTDHISPAGAIAKNSPAARFLGDKNVEQKDFNTYGARRGNDEIMARGTFANTRLINKLVEEVGPQTIHFPTQQKMAIYDAAMAYKNEGHQQIILAGQEYGSGSSRDWAAKGPYLQGINMVIAQSFERIHRSNLVGMGILPTCFVDGQSSDSLGLTGKERFNVSLNKGNLTVGQLLDVTTDCGKSFQVKVRLDTPVEVEYFKNGGILKYVMRKLIKEN